MGSRSGSRSLFDFLLRGGYRSHFGHSVCKTRLQTNCTAKVRTEEQTVVVAFPFLVGKSRTASSTKAFRDRLAVGRRADVAKLAPLDLRLLQDGGTPALFDSRTRLAVEEPLKLSWNVVVMWK